MMQGGGIVNLVSDLLGRRVQWVGEVTKQEKGKKERKKRKRGKKREKKRKKIENI